MAITYHNLYMDVRRELLRAGIEGAPLEAWELVSFASGKSRQELMRDGQLYTSNEVEERTASLVRRHLAGEPVAYLIGEWEFYGMTLDISPSVLIPRPDTEVLAEAGIRFAQEKEECRTLDLCAGSGCVGLAIASQAENARVVLGELSEGALHICRQNIRRNRLSSRVIPMEMDVMEGPAERLGKFDLVVSNPPYIPKGDIPGLDGSVKDFEPIMALDGGEDGLDFYRAICEKWRDVMHPGTRLLFEVGIGQADDVMRIMRHNGFGENEIIPDLSGIPRVVAGTLCDCI